VGEYGATPIPTAVRALAGCAVRANALLVRRRLQQPTEHRGRRLAFADGTSALVYRETRLRRPPPSEPAVLVVGFKLRLVSGPRGHAAFRVESLLNTVLFVGFPGFVSKLWLRHDDHGLYRGLYQWDRPELAEHYVGALRHVLGLVCVPGSVRHRVLPGMGRDEVLRHPAHRLAGSASSRSSDWWRLVDVEPPVP
jgi:hypothetical protein